MSGPTASLTSEIQACSACDRLRSHCEEISVLKRRSYSSENYWGKPVVGFGDPKAKVMVVGLAPGAHGANRTGRVFTGDRSGEWLYRALYRAGFSNQVHSTNQEDGLILRGAYITCVVKCAPPGNKPTLEEQRRCVSYLKKELDLFPGVRVWVALGQIAFENLWPLLSSGARRPKFQHGARIPLEGKRLLLLSYHPSQQNTFTGKLTEEMFDRVFEECVAFTRKT